MMMMIDDKDSVFDCVFTSQAGDGDDVCDDVNQIYDDLRPKLDMAIDYANQNGLELLSMPIHPFSKVSEQKVSDNKRYCKLWDFHISFLPENIYFYYSVM